MQSKRLNADSKYILGPKAYIRTTISVTKDRSEDSGDAAPPNMLLHKDDAPIMSVTISTTNDRSKASGGGALASCSKSLSIMKELPTSIRHLM